MANEDEQLPGCTDGSVKTPCECNGWNEAPPATAESTKSDPLAPDSAAETPTTESMKCDLILAPDLAVEAPTTESPKCDQLVPDSAAGTVSTEKEELVDRFLVYCQRFQSNTEATSCAAVRERYRLTDLLKSFVEDEGRKEPLTFRKRIEKADFTLPSSISLPPSQVVDLIVETAPEKLLKDLCGKGFPAGQSDETPEATAQRQQFAVYPAPNMTRFLFDIGYSLVSESAYRSILSKAVNDLSSKGPTASSEAGTVERQAQMVEHIRRVYEDTKKQNQPLKLRSYRCPIDYCDFATETQLQLYEHRRKPHKKTHRWECALCMKFSSWNDEDMEEHYNFEHGFASSAKWDLPSSRAPCPLCDQDFPYKGQMKNHLRTPGECPMNVRNVKLTSGQVSEADVLNLRLWPKVEEKRAANIPQQRKLHDQRALPALRPKDGGTLFPNRLGMMRSQQQSGRVADVVSLVAAGHGQLRAPPKPGLTTSLNLPRLFPSTVLRSTQSVQQQFVRQVYLAQQQQLQRPGIVAQSSSAGQRAPQKIVTERFDCEICDAVYLKKLGYLKHLQLEHRKLLDKSETDLVGAAPLACSRCRDRFYSYEGLERHLLMEHNLVTNELLSKAQKRQDSGKCRICTRIYAFNLLQHLVQDHQRTLCSAEIVYSCDVCHFQCNSYVQLELHLRNHHRDNNATVGLKNSFGNSGQTTGLTQPSNSLSVIAQRQQQPMLVVQQAPRSGGQQQHPNRNAAEAQTAASILNAALNNHKRSLPSLYSSARMNDQSDRPPKLMKMTDGVANRSAVASGVVNSKPQQRIQPSTATLSAASQLQLAANQRKQLRYCCTPCDLKFISYEAVLKHWVERHLKPLRVPLCRIDKCELCQETLTLKSKREQNREVLPVPEEEGERREQNGEELLVPEEEGETPEGESKTDRKEGEAGLILDLELPEFSGHEEEPKVDDEVEILPSPPKEVIFLD